PALTHEHDGIQSAVSAPWRASCMRRQALEAKLGRQQRALTARAPRNTEVVANMREENDVDILEHAGPNEKSLPGELLLGDARPEHQRPWHLLALHDLLHRQCGGDVHGLAGVVAFAVSWRTVDNRLVPRDRRLVARLWDAIDVRA